MFTDTPLIPSSSSSGKGLHLSRSQSLRSVDSHKRDDVDKPRGGQKSPQTGEAPHASFGWVGVCGCVGGVISHTVAETFVDGVWPESRLTAGRISVRCCCLCMLAMNPKLCAPVL